MATRTSKATEIRVGIGGWSYDPWHETFYPADVKKKAELAYASSQVTAIEVNATYYRTQTAATFARWRDETPDGFVFAVKASRFATNRRVLADAGESIDFFVGSGLEELGAKLGPLLWQFMPTKQFDPDDFEAFLDRLPKKVGSLALRHALDVRHESFRSEAFVALARKYKAAIVCSDSDDYPMIGDVTADFVYARLMRAKAEIVTGYAPKEIATWTAHVRVWAAGGTPRVTELPGPKAPTKKRDVFVFFINGAKERAPAGARAMLEKLAS
ncbi:MAG: DUF72 domain-containing protein [Burkholderiaceae bacterium]